MQHAIHEYDNARTAEEKAVAAEHYMEAEREHFEEVLDEARIVASAERFTLTRRIKRYVFYSLLAAFGLGLVIAFIVLPLIDVQHKTAGIAEVGPCRQAKERLGRVFLRPGVLTSFAGRHDPDCNRQSRYVPLDGCLQIDPAGMTPWCRRVYAFFRSQHKPNAHRGGVVPGSGGNNPGGLGSPPSGGPPPTLSVPPITVPGVGTTPQVNVCTPPRPALCR